MKFWSCVLAFFVALAVFGPDEENTLAARISENFANLHAEGVYASSNSNVRYNSVSRTVDEQQFYLRKLVDASQAIPSDCTQAKSHILSAYKDAVDNKVKLDWDDVINTVSSAKQYCISMGSVSDVLNSR